MLLEAWFPALRPLRGGSPLRSVGDHTFAHFKDVDRRAGKIDKMVAFETVKTLARLHIDNAKGSEAEVLR